MLITLFIIKLLARINIYKYHYCIAAGSCIIRDFLEPSILIIIKFIFYLIAVYRQAALMTAPLNILPLVQSAVQHLQPLQYLAGHSALLLLLTITVLLQTVKVTCMTVILIITILITGA